MFCAAIPAASADEGLEILSVRKIWDEGSHNAFTDLIRWRDTWYCTFREADAHVGGDGKIRVIESADGLSWKSAALIAEDGIDLRDPKLSVAPDDRLMLVVGGSVYEGKKCVGRQPRVMFSADAHQWTAPQRVLEPDEWLWRVAWHKGRAYGASYNAAARNTPAAKDAADGKSFDPGPADWKLKLVVSDDGVHYETITHLEVPGHPNETTLRFLADDRMIALVRREGGDRMGWIGTSRPPYVDWTWRATGHRFGGPNAIVLPNGSMWAAGRAYLPKKAATILARLGTETYEPALALPSGGDTSYPGLVWHDNRLWMSYYSSHEGKSSIYLAVIQTKYSER